MDFKTALENYLNSLISQNYSSGTVETSRDKLKPFEIFLKRQDKTDLRAVTSQDIQLYQREVLLREDWAHDTKQSILHKLKVFLKYLAHQQFIFMDISAVIGPLKRHRSLPQVLSEEEMNRLLSIPRVHTDTGLRDRAILELFYSSGLRLSELMNLQVKDVDFKGGEVFIRQGKGSKDRVTPVGKQAILWLEKYLQISRPRFESQRKTDCPETLFLTGRGAGFKYKENINQMLTRYKKKAQIVKRVYPHLLRHTMATHLLESGASVCVIQAMLGHSSLSTTHIYTHVAKGGLKKVHQKYHPRGKWAWK